MKQILEEALLSVTFIVIENGISKQRSNPG